MDITEIKKNLHAYIDIIDDEMQIELLNEAASVYASKQPNITDQLEPWQLNRLTESEKQADEGKLISNEEVMKLSKQWLTK